MHVNSNELFSCNPELIKYECTQLNCIFYIMYIMYFVTFWYKRSCMKKIINKIKWSIQR